MPQLSLITVIAEYNGWEQKVRNTINNRNHARVIIRGAKSIRIKHRAPPRDIFSFPRRRAVMIPMTDLELYYCFEPFGLVALSNLITQAMKRCGYGSRRARNLKQTGQARAMMKLLST